MRDELSQDRIREIADEALARIDQHSKKIIGKVEIPKWLQDPVFRFILVGRKSKSPIETGWPMYPFDHPLLLDHLSRGGNYGVRPGEGHLCVLDADNPGRLRELGVLQAFDGTFFVSNRTDGRGHYYFLCSNPPWKKLVLQDPEKTDEKGEHLHLGELFAGKGNYQVVGPGSIHPEGRRYEVRNDVPLREFSFEDLEKLFASFVRREIPAESARKYRLENRGTLTDRLGLRVEDYLMPDNPVRQGEEIQGTHPVHGSETGMNLRIDTRRNIWHCFRHKSGGDALMAFAVREGIIRCEEAAPGAFQDAHRMGEVHKALVTRGLVKENSGATTRSTGARATGTEPPMGLITFDTEKEKYVIDYPKFAAWIADRFHSLSFAGDVWVYDRGIYRKNQQDIEALVAATCQQAGMSTTIQRITNELLFRLMSINVYLRYPFNPRPDLLCVGNGVIQIDLASGGIVPLADSHEFRLNYRLVVMYDQGAVSDEIEAYLASFGAGLRDILIQVPAHAVLSMMGHTYKKAYFLKGPQDSGKSTYIEMLGGSFFGRDVVANVSLQDLLLSRFRLVELDGRILNTFADLPSQVVKNLGLFKMLTGDDSFTVERKYGDPYKMMNRAILVFSANTYPKLDVEGDDVFFNRWIPVEFSKSFPVDPTFADRTFAAVNMSALLNLVLTRVVEIKRAGLAPAASIMNAWLLESSTAYRFIHEELERCPGAIVIKARLYQIYTDWCRETDREPEEMKLFTQEIRKAGATDPRVRISGRQEHVYSGFKVKDTPPTYPDKEVKDEQTQSQILLP